MIEIRDFSSFGKADLGWLSARHHFSFADYHDPDRMNWGALRVWNDDTIQPNTGFEQHGHRDMEIITFVRKGAITHKDHMGNEGRTLAGDVQVMSAGKGVIHEEHNLEADITQIFQIWIMPAETSGEPFWAAQEFPAANQADQLIELASGRPRASASALPIRQNAAIYGATLTPGAKVTHKIDAGRLVYLTASKGTVLVNGKRVDERSAAAIEKESLITIQAPEDTETPSEIILADIPPM